MMVYSDGSIYLEAGEAVPVVCRCGEVYQPDLYSEESICQKCGTFHDHTQAEEFLVILHDQDGNGVLDVEA